MRQYLESPAFQNVLAMVISTVVLPFMFVLFKEAIKYLREKTKNTQFAALPDILDRAAETAVANVEQKYPLAAKEIKREMAIEAMKELLPNKTISTIQTEVASPHKDPPTALNDVLGIAVEAAVQKKNDPPPVIVAVPSDVLPGGLRKSDPPAPGS